MTPSYPAPTWAHIDAFCAADGWENVRETNHAFWEKTLPNGETLKTHRSFSAGKAITEGVFGVILREQLKVNREQFWQAINTGEPVDRPVELDEPTPEYPGWVVGGLLRFDYDESQIREMTPAEAEALLIAKWSSPSE